MSKIVHCGYVLMLLLLLSDFGLANPQQAGQKSQLVASNTGATRSSSGQSGYAAAAGYSSSGGTRTGSGNQTSSVTASSAQPGRSSGYAGAGTYDDNVKDLKKQEAIRRKYYSGYGVATPNGDNQGPHNRYSGGGSYSRDNQTDPHNRGRTSYAGGRGQDNQTDPHNRGRTSYAGGGSYSRNNQTDPQNRGRTSYAGGHGHDNNAGTENIPSKPAKVTPQPCPPYAGYSTHSGYSGKPRDAVNPCHHGSGGTYPRKKLQN